MKLRLSDIYELQMGKTPARNMPEFWNGTNAWVSISDLTQNSKYISQTKECITDEAVSRTNIKKVPKDTLLMSFKLSLGKVAITATDIYTNEAIMAFIDKKVHDVDIHFMYHYFQAIDWTIGTNKAVKGITLNKSSLSEKVIELPPIQIQRKIAEHLDKMSAVEENIQCQLSLFDKLVKSQFVEMFGDPVTNPMGWEIFPLKELTSKIGSGATPKGGNASYKEQGISLIRSMNVYNGYFDYEGLAHIDEKQASLLDNVILESNDVLLNITGASVARCCIVPNDILPARVNQHVCILRCDQAQIIPMFLNAVFISEQHQAKLWNIAEAGATRQALSKEKIEVLPIIKPPLTLQNEFAAFVEQADKSEFLLRQLLEKQQTLKKALMQEYFS